MQVDPVKPTLKALGIKLLKLNYDEPLSKFAFKLNLRRYSEVVNAVVEGAPDEAARLDGLYRTVFQYVAVAGGTEVGAYARPLFGST